MVIWWWWVFFGFFEGLITLCIIKIGPSTWVVFQLYGVGSLWEFILCIHLLSFSF